IRCAVRAGRARTAPLSRDGLHDASRAERMLGPGMSGDLGMRDPLSRLLILGAAVAMVGVLLLPISDDAPFGFSEPALPAFLTLAAVFLRPRGEPRRRPACCPRTVSRCLSIAMAAALVICMGQARTDPPVVVDDSVILA